MPMPTKGPAAAAAAEAAAAAASHKRYHGCPTIKIWQQPQCQCLQRAQQQQQQQVLSVAMGALQSASGSNLDAHPCNNLLHGMHSSTSSKPLA
jgi:hypothetical protein